MLDFRNFVGLDEEAPVVTAQPGVSLNDKEHRDNINADLAEVTAVPYSWPLAGYEAIKDTLSEHGLDLPNTELDDDDDTDEIVFGVAGTPYFLYVYYAPCKNKKLEFYAEIVNEEEMHELLDEFDVGENEEEEDDADDDDDNREEEYSENNDNDR